MEKNDGAIPSSVYAAIAEALDVAKDDTEFYQELLKPDMSGDTELRYTGPTDAAEFLHAVREPMRAWLQDDLNLDAYDDALTLAWPAKRDGFYQWLLRTCTPEQQVRALAAALEAEQAKWRCFHCGFVTSDRVQAEAHWGEESGQTPLCLWSQIEGASDLQHLQSTLVELAKEQNENGDLMLRVEELQARLTASEAEVARLLDEVLVRLECVGGAESASILIKEYKKRAALGGQKDGR